MKKICALLLVFIAFTACKQPNPNTFVINGKIEGVKEGTLVELKLKDPEFFLGKQEKVIDTATIKGGKFQFTGGMDTPRLHTITILEPEKDRLEKKIIPIFLENSTIEIFTDIDKIPTLDNIFNYNYDFDVVKITGSDSHKNYKDYLKKLQVIMQSENLLWEESTKNFKEKRKLSISEGIELATRFEKSNTLKQDFLLDFIKNNINNIVGQYVAYITIINQEVGFSKDQFNELIASIPDNINDFPGTIALRENAISAAHVAPGAQYVDLSFNDKDGNPLKLSDYVAKGKYVLVEFWASWCGPCRLDIPHLKDVYELYNKEGFEIISVSMDEDHEAWLQAIEEEQMPWLQVSDGKGFDGAISEVYKIFGIPACFLIDPNGKIITDNMRGSYMDKRLIEMYGNKFGDKY
ncbi:TlpA disulfide reductase family protein [Flavivirga eckloniae]|uniref:Thioredoxin domain-containing protein n=1 Tax=Flavivirga eckloniae TaxID=1803846 RepID=A0A2K9PTY0_9FLAO|nr:TlpA disulfide reductase family protein [Flavivirga eckloniae]AUP80516.1 hypothetical protein C1H87_18080 [Flavivirga eckloniae]